SLAITDNGRGIPVDPHPKFKNKSALEVIMTTLHSGGKFGSGAYKTSGGLHGVGVSVVNALSQWVQVEVAKDKQLWAQRYARGHATSNLQSKGTVNNRRGTRIHFLPDPEIFGTGAGFKAARLYRMARSKAYLFRGVEIRWRCAPEALKAGDITPAEATLHFPGGLTDYLKDTVNPADCVTAEYFTGRVALPEDAGQAEWAVAWPGNTDGFIHSYCNTVPTPEGGTHEQGFRAALTKGLRAYGELVGNKKAKEITAEDVVGPAAVLLSVFIKEPQFQGQTKEKLASPEAARLVEVAVRDHFDHWLSG